MKSIKIKDNEYKLPESYSDISILKFQELLDLEAASLSEFDKHIHIISVLLDMDILDVYQIPLSLIKQINDSLSFITLSKVSDELRTTISVKDNELHLIDVTVLTWSEWTSLEHYIKEDIYKNIHNIMSILYRPLQTKKNILQRFGIKKPSIIPYDFQTSSSLAPIIQEEVSIQDVNGALTFFLHIGIPSILNSLGYSPKQLKKMMKTSNLSPKEKETIDNLSKIMKGGIGSLLMKG
jgi:hypothetical protein